VEWIERIERVDNKLYAVYADGNGNRRHDGLSAIRDAMPRHDVRAAEGTALPLNNMRAVDPREYLEAIGLPAVGSEGHQVFELYVGGRKVLMPAAVALLGLIVNLGVIGDSLLEPTSLERIVVPLIGAEGLRLEFTKRTKLRQPVISDPLDARYKWLTCYPSAHKLWNSVHRHAMQGVLGFTPPMALVDASFYGRVVAGTVIATRMAVRSLVPNEQPYPFAADYVPRRFALDGRKTAAANSLTAFHASGAPNPRVARQADIPMGAIGYAMTSEEWEYAHEKLKDAGYQPKFSVKSTLDLALEKYGSGKSWSSFGAKSENSTMVVKLWKRRGQWDAFKRILRELRCTGAAQLEPATI
jgi:hypothetical protein